MNIRRETIRRESSKTTLRHASYASADGSHPRFASEQGEAPLIGNPSPRSTHTPLSRSRLFRSTSENQLRTKSSNPTLRACAAFGISTHITWRPTALTSLNHERHAPIRPSSEPHATTPGESPCPRIATPSEDACVTHPATRNGCAIANAAVNRAPPEKPKM